MWSIGKSPMRGNLFKMSPFSANFLRKQGRFADYRGRIQRSGAHVAVFGGESSGCWVHIREECGLEARRKDFPINPQQSEKPEVPMIPVGWPKGILICALTMLMAVSGALAENGSDEQPATEEEKPRSALRAGGGISPKFSLHGFADASFIAEDVSFPEDDDETKAGFFLGEFDLYMVSQLSPKWSFLGELVFEFEQGGETRADVERVFVKYSVSDMFWTSFGRRHTPLGYWNETYHHGLFLQPTVERPLVLRFEDQGGVLPIHAVGIEVGGRKFTGPWSLDYRGGVYNGRGPTREVVQSLGDANVNKAALLKLTASHDRSNRFRFGGMVYRDEIPPNTEALAPHAEMDERIYGIHFIYEREQIKFYSELYDIRHLESGTSEDWDHLGYYVLAVWRPWAWKPYLGYEVLDLEEGDPYYDGIPTPQKRALAGVRFDPIPFLALKFELRRDDFTDTEANGVAVQVAYTF